MFTGADVFCRMPIVDKIKKGKNREINCHMCHNNNTNHLPDIEFDIELGMLTGCDEFCSKPVEAKPADIEFSK